MTASRGWCFTVNNHTTDCEKRISELGNSEVCRYLIFGREIGENGTPHLQGYLELKTKQRLSWLKKKHETAHWEARKGTPDEARTYCMKSGEFVEFGRPLEQGRRVDLEEVASRVRDGASLAEMDLIAPGLTVQYSRGLEALRLRQLKDRMDPPKVYWLWGLTGAGKTRKAVGEGVTFYMKDGTKWWDGYDQQTRIVIDDFDGSWPFRDLLRLLDRYPYQGQTKGGYVKINSPEIYITCEHPICHFWSGSEYDQIIRRLTKAILVVPQVVVPEVALG